LQHIRKRDHSSFGYGHITRFGPRPVVSPDEQKISIRPFVFNPSTGKRWSIPCDGDFDSGHVTPDGRFAAVIVRPNYPRWAQTLGDRWYWYSQRLESHPRSWQLHVYECPGRLRAYARARETSPIDPNAEHYGKGFILSPDGHTIIFANGYHWKIYRW